MSLPYRLLFAGTDVFALPSLKILAQTWPQALLGVITQPDRPSGRGLSSQPSAVAQTASALDLPLFKPANRNELAQVVRQCAPDLVVVIAYGRLIPLDLLASVPHGWLNVHPSLLPRHRGPTPIESAILAGDQETGLSFMLLDEAVDHGPILQQIKYPLSGQETAGELSMALAEQAGQILLGVIEAYGNGELKPRPQNHTAATFTKLLQRADGLIDWTQEQAEQIERKVRAFTPWPGAFCILASGERLKILSGKAVNDPNILRADGETKMLCAKDGLFFACAKNTTYQALQVQREGKKPVSGTEFCRGYRG